MMTPAESMPLPSYPRYSWEEMRLRAASFREEMQRKRSVRQLSDRPVEREIIEQCLMTAGSAPSGANLQPWQFVVVSESVGIATGMLITALHRLGLATLTHTPSPMGFLSQILSRPADGRPYLILVVGHPAEEAVVPRIPRKALAEIATFL